MEKKNLKWMPDQRLHMLVSFVKSGIRIIGCITLMFDVNYGASMLLLAEVVGIVEELV